MADGSLKTCPTCKGTRVFFGGTCPECNGDGEVLKRDADLEREGQLNLLQPEDDRERRRAS